MSGEEICVGEELLEHSEKLMSVMESVSEAYVLSANAYAKISDESSYVGVARDELLMYFWSVQQHMAKLYDLYSKTNTYVMTVYYRFYYCDEQISTWILGNMQYFGGTE